MEPRQTKRILFDKPEMVFISFTSLKTVQSVISNVVRNAFYNEYNQLPSDEDVKVYFPLELTTDKVMTKIQMTVFFFGDLSGHVHINHENSQFVVEYKSS